MVQRTWQPVKNYEGLYQISDCGLIRSLDRYVFISNGNKRIIKGQLIKFRTNSKGYLVVTLYKNGLSKTFRVSRLVAETFVPNRDNKCCVNHIDGDKLNNKADNLAWVTYSENNAHAHQTGLRKPARYTPVIDTCTNQLFQSIKEAAISYNIPYDLCTAYLHGYRQNPTCLKFAS